jgi:hypothetical protein
MKLSSEQKQAVGEALGEASMCWSKTPGGEFEASRASEIIDRLVAFLESDSPMPFNKVYVLGPAQSATPPA